MTSLENLNLAIGAHGLWKSRLKVAIETGQCDVVANDARRNDVCAFGKWLLSSNDQGSRFRKVDALHRQFHSAVGRVLDLALTGRKDTALTLMNTDGEYARISLALTREMMEWKRELS